MLHTAAVSQYSENPNVFTLCVILATYRYRYIHIGTTIVVFDSSLDRKSSPKVRSSRQQMFSKIGVLKNFAKFTRKHRC